MPYAFLGQLTTGNLTASLVFAPLAPVGIWLGVWLHRRISERALLRRQLHSLFLTGVKLILDAVTH